MTHEEYVQLSRRIDSEDLTDGQFEEMEAHSNECQICYTLKIRDEDFLKKNSPQIVDAIVDVMMEEGCEALGIPSTEEDHKLFLKIMTENV